MQPVQIQPNMLLVDTWNKISHLLAETGKLGIVIRPPPRTPAADMGIFCACRGPHARSALQLWQIYIPLTLSQFVKIDARVRGFRQTFPRVCQGAYTISNKQTFVAGLWLHFNVFNPMSASGSCDAWLFRKSSVSASSSSLLFRLKLLFPLFVLTLGVRSGFKR